MEHCGVRLLVAEKPSVGAAIGAVLGAVKKRNGWLEGAGWWVSWCLGHLVELSPPEAYDPRYAKWDYGLPIIPETWKQDVIPETKQQYEILAKLMNSPDVSEICEATDAGKEGELIFRRVYEQCGCTKPVRRLWISSLSEDAIRDGLTNLRDASEYDRLYQAAVCRARADWLVGMNLTRRVTTFYGGETLNVGRVMTPTLALLVERENAIANFQKETFHTVELSFSGFWAVSGRFADRKDAERLQAACAGTAATVRTVERKEKREQPPKLYDLTTLQREANRLFGYTAQQTLDFLQSLYEKRLATYPRTDSRYLTEDMAEGLPALCEETASVLPFVKGFPLPVHPDIVTDNSKVTDHHAVIPTSEIVRTDLNALPKGERDILHMIAVRLLCAVGEPYRYAETAVTLDCGGAEFSARGRTVTEQGWKAVEDAFRATIRREKPKRGGQKSQREEQAQGQREDLDESQRVQSQPLPRLDVGQTVSVREAVVRQGSTKPLSRFTEDTLLSAMEHASAEDFAKIESPERTGLGTPATRAATIEKLVKSKFAERKKRQIVPTEKGMELIRALPEPLTSAKLTADWENQLCQIERGELSSEVFLSGIVAMVRNLVRSYEDRTPEPSTLSQSWRPIVGTCPRCGRNVVEGKFSFHCSGYYDQPPCMFAIWKNERFFTAKRKKVTRSLASALLQHGRVRMTGLYSEKKDTTYDATVVMEDTGEKYLRFRLEFDEKPEKGTAAPKKRKTGRRSG